DKTLGKDHPYYSSNTISMAKLYWSMGEIAKAKSFYEVVSAASFERINKIFQFTSEAEKDAYIKNINGTSDEYLSFFYKELNKEDATQPLLVSLRNRTLILSSTQQLRSIIYMRSDSNLLKKFDTWTSQKQKLGQLYVNAEGTTADEIKTLEEKANVLEKELSRSSNNFKAAQQKAVDWKLLQQSLKPGEAAIEFMDFRYNDGARWTDSTFYVAILLRKETRPKMIHLFEKKELDDFIGSNATVSEMYAQNRSRKVNNRNLFELVWKPLEKELNGIKKIYFAPAGKLHQLAFSALPISASESLIDRYQLVQLNTTYSLTSSTTNQKGFNDRVKIYGGIIYDEDVDVGRQNTSTSLNTTSETDLAFPTDNTRGKNWTYLPGTQKEINAIKKLADAKKIKVDLSEGIKATEESFKILNGKSSPGFLHIATHGFFFPDPKEDKRSEFQKSFDKSGVAFKQSDNPLMRSGLLFAGANNTWQGKPLGRAEDGFLTAYEVASLYLPNTKLVVLSACETALGDVQGSEGVYGLQRSFKMAGVQHLIMSLWKVPDNETAEFMQEFYKKYFGGKDVNVAFRESQTLMRNRYKDEPVKWAAWILVQ
ncbi:MAG: CHAT domain-containing protein, partial [Ferruginibacter sp.]|nr:CHAT domain-containing protein [Ferruginibacter sp.]